jgi:hypothetical protein
MMTTIDKSEFTREQWRFLSAIQHLLDNCPDDMRATLLFEVRGVEYGGVCFSCCEACATAMIASAADCLLVDDDPQPHGVLQ